MARLTEAEAEALAEEHAKNPPRLSGNPIYISELEEKALVFELLPKHLANLVIKRADVLSITPSAVLCEAVENLFVYSIEPSATSRVSEPHIKYGE